MEILENAKTCKDVNDVGNHFSNSGSQFIRFLNSYFKLYFHLSGY